MNSDGSQLKFMDLQRAWDLVKLEGPLKNHKRKSKLQTVIAAACARSLAQHHLVKSILEVFLSHTHVEGKFVEISFEI